MRKKTIILHPVLFAISPILYFLSVNKEKLSLGNSDFLIALAISLLITGIMWAVLSVVLKDKRKAAVIISLFALLFFSYGHVRKFIEDFNLELAGFNIGPDKILLSAWGVILLLGSFLSFKTKKNLRTLTNFLNIVAISLVLIPLVNIVPYELKTGKATLPTSQESAVTEETAELTPEEAAKLPDIYYLIFDRYANETTLKEEFDFDNTKFLTSLEEKGFYIASKSTANYPRTFNSLASSLNMTHLTYLEKEMENVSSIKPLYGMIENNQVVETLKDWGYKYIHVGDWYPATKENRHADININYFSGIQNDFVDKLLETTIIDPILEKLSKEDPRRRVVRARHLYEFKKLKEEISTMEGPKFVFAHMLTPHDPYVFDKDGNSLSEEEEKTRTPKENYINQLIFLNTQIEEIVASILEKSKKAPIIILQSDEGPFTKEWSKTAGGPDDFREISNKGLQTHLRILNAYFLPQNESKKNLYSSITPVNTFRLVFNLYFGAEYKLLKDKSYIHQDRKHPYKFVEVTDKVKFD